MEELLLEVPVLYKNGEAVADDKRQEVIQSLVDKLGNTDPLEMSGYRAEFNEVYSINIPDGFLAVSDVEMSYIHGNNPFFNFLDMEEDFSGPKERISLFILEDFDMVFKDLWSFMMNSSDQKFLYIKRDEMDLTNEEVYVDEPGLVRGSDEHLSRMKDRLKTAFGGDGKPDKTIETDEGIVIHYQINDGSSHGKFVVEYNNYQFVGFFNFGSDNLNEKTTFIEELLGSIRLKKDENQINIDRH